MNARLKKSLTATALMAGVLGFVSLEYIPTMLASRETKAFCGNLAPGTPIADVTARAGGAGYKVSKLKETSWMLEHRHSIGRAWCVVHDDADGRVTRVVIGD